MKNLTTLVSESNVIDVTLLNEIKNKIIDGLNGKYQFTISCDNFNLNSRFSNRVGGYALESIINQILGEDENFDAVYNNQLIEIKSIKDNKYSSYKRMFTPNEINALDKLVVIFIDYTHSGNTYNIKKISICPGIDVKDNNPKKVAKDAQIFITNKNIISK